MLQLTHNLTQTLSTSRAKRGTVHYEGPQHISVNRSMLFLILKNLVTNGLKYNESEEGQGSTFIISFP